MAITVFTDGSSRGNPGPGGWAAFVIDNNTKVVELGGREDHTTNNRMELTAAVEALRLIRERGFTGEIELYSDSAYVLNGITSWVYGWERNDWLTKEKEPVLNQDLWQALLEISRQLKLHHTITWKKVEGHSGLAGNERVDEIATGFADKKVVLLYTGTYKDYLKMLGSDIFHIAGPKEKSGGKKNSTAKAYSYVSMVHGVIHTDATWAACEKRVKGKKGAKYRKSFSAEDEVAIIKEFSK